jgi:nucleoside-diphosphate-sugar epimerase
MRLLVTGASGFVGRAVLARAVGESALQVRAAARRHAPSGAAGAENVLVGDLTPDTDWSEALGGVDAVVHAAARVHVMSETAADPLAEFRRVNVAGTLNLARQAAESKVRRFIFISSIKVNGEGTRPGRPYTPEDVPAPLDPYGISKHEAEVALRRLAQETNLEMVIIRPVLVYGPGVKGNFLAMMRWLNRGVPLPLRSIENRRSLLALDNLVDFILTCVHHPLASNETFLVSDGEDLSTADLIRRLARAMGRPSRLIPVPSAVLMAGATLVGRREVAQRLIGSLQVDISKARRILSWAPPVSVDEGLRRASQGCR